MRRLACLMGLLSTGAFAATARAPARLLAPAPKGAPARPAASMSDGPLAALAGVTVMNLQGHRVAVKPEYSRGPMASFEMKF